MSVVLDAINENLKHIKIIFEPTANSFRRDTKQTEDARELTVKEFIESFFPSNYKVKKGLIYSVDGYSREIDCVLLAPNHPPLVTPIREVIIAEGVHAAIEVKPDITTLSQNSEFYRGLKQIQTVKKLKRDIAYLPTNEIPIEQIDKRIPCVLFSNKSRNHRDTINYMINLTKNSDFESCDLPDLIVTMDNGVIYHTSSASSSIFRNLIKFNIKNHSEKLFIYFGNEYNPLALFLLILYSFTPPEPLINESILKSYLPFQPDTAISYEY